MSAVLPTFGSMSLHAGPDASVHCGTYTHGPLPNLSVHGRGVTMTLYLAGEVIDAGHVRFARDLVTQVQRFAAECERLHAVQAELADGAA
jgi:hypothetical protein